MPLKISKLANSLNIAEELKDDALVSIGRKVYDSYVVDERSREEWKKQYEESLKLASQIKEAKTFPWKGAANIKYPLLTNACLHFNAKALPALLPNDSIASFKTVNTKAPKEVLDSSIRLSKFVNYQFIEGMDTWVDDMDQLLITLPITGTVYKKIYFDTYTNSPKVEVLNATDICVNYNAKDLATAPRITHVIFNSKNEVLSKMREGLFLDLPESVLGKPRNLIEDVKNTNSKAEAQAEDDSTPYCLLEQHRWLDLDDDGYEEPYIVTIEKESTRVLRIVPRFSEASIAFNEDEEIIRIEPENYFIDYKFIPDPSGSIYGIGWGTLLAPINETVNTSINQLLDAGTLDNLPSGFLGKSLKMPGGNYYISPGEWKFVNNSGIDISRNIVPLPTKGPQVTSMKLLEYMVGSGEKMSNTLEAQMGENPGQNQPLGTTIRVLEEGSKIFNAVFRRIRNKINKEIQMVLALDAQFLPEEVYAEFFSGEEAPVDKTDFMFMHKIMPAATSTSSSQAINAAKAQMLMEMSGGGGFRMYEVRKRVLDAHEIPGAENLLIPPEEEQPPTDPTIEVASMKAQVDLQVNSAKAQNDQLKLMIEAEKSKQQQQEKFLQFELQKSKQELEQYKMMVEAQLKEMDMKIRAATEMAKMESQEQIAKQKNND